MMHASIHGCLVTVKPLKTKTGISMTVGSLVVNLPIAQTEEQEGQWFNVLSFGETAEELAKVEPKSNVSLMGRVQFSRYEKDGETRTVLQIIADNVISVRTSRPRGGRKAATSQVAGGATPGYRGKRQDKPQGNPDWDPTGRFQDPKDPFGDEIPF